MSAIPFPYVTYKDAHNYFAQLIEQMKLITYEPNEAGYYDVPWHICDIVVDAFTGKVRLNCSKKGKKPPIIEWRCGGAKRTMRALANVANPSPDMIYETFRKSYPYFCTEYPVLRAIQVLGLLQKMVPQSDTYRMLDPCSGYGSRLLAALMMKNVEYEGYDTNKDLQDGHAKLMRFVASKPGMKTDLNHYINYSAFDRADHYQICKNGLFDFAFTSPPFWNLEIYSNYVGDSIQEYPSYIAWKENFLFTLINLTMRALKPGGVFAIYVSNIGKAAIMSDTISYIESCGYSYEILNFTRDNDVKNYRSIIFISSSVSPSLVSNRCALSTQSSPVLAH